MELRNLGRTDIKITPIGLGVWQFAANTGIHKYFWNKVDATDDIIKNALDGEINWFDTAEMYGKGKSEIGLSKGLLGAGKKDGDVIIGIYNWIHYLSPSDCGRYLFLSTY